jgi:hypothetical protein
MHARMLCINAPLRLCNKQRSVEAPSKDYNETTLKRFRRRTEPCCKNRRLPPLSQATVKYKEYILLHYLDTDSSWREREIRRNSGHQIYRHHRSPTQPSYEVCEYFSGAVRYGTVSVPRDPDSMYHSTLTSRRDGSAAGGGRLQTCSGTDGNHVRYSSRRTS